MGTARIELVSLQVSANSHPAVTARQQRGFVGESATPALLAEPDELSA
jgi:hypothetical protein